MGMPRCSEQLFQRHVSSALAGANGQLPTGRKHSGNAHRCGAAPLPCRTIGPGLRRLSSRTRRASKPDNEPPTEETAGVTPPRRRPARCMPRCAAVGRHPGRDPYRGPRLLITVPNRRRSTNDPNVPSMSGDAPLAVRSRASFNQNSCVPGASFLYHEIHVDPFIQRPRLAVPPPRFLHSPSCLAMALGEAPPTPASLFSPHFSETRSRVRLLGMCGPGRIRHSGKPDNRMRRECAHPAALPRCRVPFQSLLFAPTPALPCTLLRRVCQRP